MISILLAVIIGLAVAGLVHLPLRLLPMGKKTRMAITVFAAGAGMLCYQIYDEYTWYQRAGTRLGPQMQIIQSFEETSLLRPWARKWPYVSRFTAISHAETKTNDAQPNMFIVTTYLTERNRPTLKLRLIVDCAQSRRTYFDNRIQFDETGAPVDAPWIPMQADEPLRIFTCNRAPHRL